MIKNELHNPAISAIGGLLSVARFRALKGCDSVDLAVLLDNLSYLPQLILDSEDRTSLFVECLQNMVRLVPETELVLCEFQAHMTLEQNEIKSDAFAVEIEIQFDDDEHEISAPDIHAAGIHSMLIGNGVSCVLRPSKIQLASGNFREEYEIGVSGHVNGSTLISAVRDYLRNADIEWTEPYAEGASMESFRFTLPRESLRK